VIFLIFIGCVGALLILSYKTCQLWFLNTERFFIDLTFVIFFLIGQIIHSQQTETTRRLDFIWKLQATGKAKNNVNLNSLSHLNLTFALRDVIHRGEGRHGKSPGLQ
jgi:hypothetical protein